MSVAFNVGDLVVTTKTLRVRRDGLCMSDSAYQAWGINDTTAFDGQFLDEQQPCVVLDEFLNDSLIVLGARLSRTLIVKKENLKMLVLFSNLL